MSLRLIDSLASTEALAEVFSDASVLQAMLDFEAALARAQASVGLIPSTAAAAITAAGQANGFDTAKLASQSLRAGTPAMPLVKMLTDRVRATDPSSADYVHWGATSQDVTDTALALLLKRSFPMLEADHARLEHALERLSNQHAGTLMLGRTLLQPAPPIPFGLKAAGWLAAAHRGWGRVAEAFEQALILQFGGASGTLAALGDQGPLVSSALARELGLHDPGAPWHTQRDRLAALVSVCGIYVASLGKMARDVSLMMQEEVGEAAEAEGAGRGGSSTMPHKRNPIACVLALAAANRIPGLVASYLAGMVQEHERATGGWQAEWATILGVIQSTGVALESMAEAAEGLTVHPERMRANIEETRGAIFAERVVILLAASLGRAGAHRLLEEVTRWSAASGRKLTALLAEIPEVTQVIPAAELEQLDSPESYLGAAEHFRKRLLSKDSSGGTD